MPKISFVVLSVYFRDFVVSENHSLSERVAVVENDIAHIQADINEIARLARESSERHDKKLEKVLKISGELKQELTRYKIVSGTALAILSGIIAGANYLMSIFGISITDLWGKK